MFGFGTWMVELGMLVDQEAAPREVPWKAAVKICRVPTVCLGKGLQKYIHKVFVFGRSYFSRIER